jgi:hypothetical protein
METSSTFIGLILICLIILPLTIIYFSNQKKTKKSFAILSSFAFEHESTISVHEFWRNHGIGFDKYSDKLFFISEDNGFSKKQLVDLSNKIECQVYKNYIGIETASGMQQVLEKVGITIKERISTGKDILIDFYDYARDGANINFEIKLAEKWAEIINSDLKLNS